MAALLASAGADYVIAAISVDMTAGLNDLIIDVLVIVLSIPPGKIKNTYDNWNALIV